MLPRPSGNDDDEQFHHQHGDSSGCAAHNSVQDFVSKCERRLAAGTPAGVIECSIAIRRDIDLARLIRVSTLRNHDDDAVDVNDSSDYRSPYAFAVSRYSNSALRPLGYVSCLAAMRLGKSDLIQEFLGISLVQSQDPSEPANGITNSKYSEVRSSLTGASERTLFCAKF
eukprot:COSAG05_NODE_162_length_15499_cov_23.006104_1_plen_170_part_00